MNHMILVHHITTLLSHTNCAICYDYERAWTHAELWGAPPGINVCSAFFSLVLLIVIIIRHKQQHQFFVAELRSTTKVVFSQGLSRNRPNRVRYRTDRTDRTDCDRSGPAPAWARLDPNFAKG